MCFSTPEIVSIETILRQRLSTPWRRLDVAELRLQPVANPAAGWEVSLPPDSVAHPNVDHLWLVIDRAFPRSQPRIIAPQAANDPPWPHVEEGGLLCLNATRLSVAPDVRAFRHLGWAQELLSYTDDECRREFEREFYAYWDHRLSKPQRSSAILSLLAPQGPSRRIVAFAKKTLRQIVVADNKDLLLGWLRHSGENPSSKEIFNSYLIWLPRPWTPGEFPQQGEDLLRLIPAEAIRHILSPERYCPVVCGANTISGPVFVCALLRSESKKEIAKGFRSFSRVPFERIAMSFRARPVVRCRVSRIDASWVHGRDHNSLLRSLLKNKVAIIGCGALGGSISRLLAQAGVGSFVLIDPDYLKPENMSRHVLGQQFFGEGKAIATDRMLQEDFPHLTGSTSIRARFDELTRDQLEALSGCDIIISAGISFEGDSQIDAWRKALPRPPAHVCTWVEHFAIVGHAVALVGSDTLLDAFDEQERVIFRLTDWPATRHALIREAGCGNVFQPHGAVELQSTVRMAAALALDVLSGNVTASLRRVWLGDPDAVRRQEGTVLDTFNDRWCMKEYPWG